MFILTRLFGVIFCDPDVELVRCVSRLQPLGLDLISLASLE